jgi:succinate dehydrogenase hydrophobic anchor subunit
MLRVVTQSALTRSYLAVRSTRRVTLAAPAKMQPQSTKAGPLEADSGPLATRVHHTMSLSLAILAPAYFMAPDDGMFGKVFGVALSTNIAAHSWIGMNYVVTDYVPKISKSLLGPARVFNAGLAGVTLLGLSYIAVSSKGGIKGCVKGLWNPPPVPAVATK